ncbi:MAG: dTDP-4-dehydrorhamnose 3,5-epimerase [Acidobacteria bacterium RIFCSPLOWO2_02_FULL_67_36]|nr:MAG: dTDP-4-dehydrorhamnose 3,5-epimerase [Acidobacteria bacterium RIFCSPLOWO2_02_FULL_67_36]
MMKITVTETPLSGVVLVDTHYFHDDRGFFIESWHRRDYADAGLTMTFVQEGHSRSGRGVLRGLHYQDMTAPMGKLVRCTLGRIIDVAVDLRVGSRTFGKWTSVELTAENKRQIYVPEGFAHAFQTLSDVAEVQYKQTGFYTPSSEGTLAWNDPDVGIEWPLPDPILSERDKRGMSLKQYLEKPAFRVPV